MSGAEMPPWAAAMEARLNARLDNAARILERVEVKADLALEASRNLQLRASAGEAHLGYIVSGIGAFNGRMDAFEVRLTLAEKRLELRDGNAAA